MYGPCDVCDRLQLICGSHKGVGYTQVLGDGQIEKPCYIVKLRTWRK